MTPAERLAAGLVRMPTGCLEWTKSVDGRGYGRITVSAIRASPLLTHRLAWTLVNGPIPDGLHVLHHCDNPPCCQTEPTPGYPDGHLFIGTQADNVADMSTKGRVHNQSVTHCPQGHTYTDANTYTYRNMRSCRTCIRERNRVWKARDRARRKALSDPPAIVNVVSSDPPKENR